MIPHRAAETAEREKIKSMTKSFVLIFGLLILSNACGSVVSNSAIPAIREKEIGPPPQNPETINEFGQYCHKYIEKDFAQIAIKNTAPAIITNIVSVNGKKDFKEGVDIEIKNVSDKPLRSLFLDISPPDCMENLYTALPMVEVDEKTVINPGETVIKHLSTKDSTGYFKMVKCREKMPNASPKPFVSVDLVKFSDGSEWKAANNCLEDKIKPPQVSPNQANVPAQP